MSKFIEFEHLVYGKHRHSTHFGVFVYIAAVYVLRNSLFGFISDNKICRQSFLILFIAEDREGEGQGERERENAKAGRQSQIYRNKYNSKYVNIVPVRICQQIRFPLTLNGFIASIITTQRYIYTTLSQTIPYSSLSLVLSLSSFFLFINNSFFIFYASLCTSRQSKTINICRIHSAFINFIQTLSFLSSSPCLFSTHSCFLLAMVLYAMHCDGYLHRLFFYSHFFCVEITVDADIMEAIFPIFDCDNANRKYRIARLK